MQVTDWPLEQGREFNSEHFTEEELTDAQRLNVWLRDKGEEDPYPTWDYGYTFYECKTLQELKQAFLYGNWSIRQCFTFKNLAFVNQVNAGDEWWTVKKLNGVVLAFESISMIPVIRKAEGYFEDYINQLLKASYTDCRTLNYTDEEFEDKWRGPLPGDAVLIINTDDSLIEEESIGIIEGMVGEKRPEYLVCFNARTHWQDETGVVSCSGGPGFYIEASKLKPTGKKVEINTWYFPNNFWGAHLGEDKKRRVNLFKYDRSEKEK